MDSLITMLGMSTLGKQYMLNANGIDSNGAEAVRLIQNTKTDQKVREVNVIIVFVRWF